MHRIGFSPRRKTSPTMVELFCAGFLLIALLITALIIT